MPYCTNCGSSNEGEARFCFSCGKELRSGSSTDSGLPVPPSTLVRREPIPPVSRLSRSGVEKFLVQGEHIIYATSGMVQIGEKRKKAYVTTRRLLLYRSDGLLFRRDSLDEVDLRTIGRATLTEFGLVMKEYVLEIDGMQLKGRRSDLLNLYRILQTAKAAPLV